MEERFKMDAFLGISEEDTFPYLVQFTSFEFGPTSFRKLTSVELCLEEHQKQHVYYCNSHAKYNEFKST